MGGWVEEDREKRSVFSCRRLGVLEGKLKLGDVFSGNDIAGRWSILH